MVLESFRAARGGFPFLFAGQTPAGPGAAGLGLPEADADHGLAGAIPAPIVPSSGFRHPFRLQPSPPVLRPPPPIAIATVVKEVPVLAVGDRIAAEQERHFDLDVGFLVVAIGIGSGGNLDVRAGVAQAPDARIAQPTQA